MDTLTDCNTNATPGETALPLYPEHRADLEKSGLTDDTIRAAALRTITDPEEVGRVLNWTGPAHDLGPCLAFPFLDADGRPNGYTRLKPSRPRMKKGKAIKYESPLKSKNQAYITPAVRGALAKIKRGDFLFTEGEKKALAAIQAGFPCIGLVGVYGWQVKRPTDAKGKPKGRRRLIPDLRGIKWRGRRVFIVFDSDAKTNPNVRRAEAALATALRRAGAKAVVVRLPAAENGEKQGLDDYLVAQGPAALRRLLDESAARAADTETARDFGASLFRDPAELDRLAALKLDDAALYAAEKALLKKRGVSLRELDKIIGERAAALRAGRARQTDQPDRADLPYIVRGGMTYRVAQTQNGPVEFPISNFTATITAETTRDDGAETRRFFTLTGRTAAGHALPPTDVPADQFPGMGWITGAWGNRAVVYAGMVMKDHLRVAIQTTSGDLPTRTVYTHTGWREAGGVWVYLHAGGCISAVPPPDEAVVSLDGPLAGYELPPPPAESALVTAIRTAISPLSAAGRLAPDRILVPVFGAVFRAALGGVIDFGVHLHGRTGTFKSEIAALAQQWYGPRMDARNLPANWASTANAIEGTAFTAKDALVVLDDFNPTGVADPGKLQATADRVFRGLGNGAGRQRMTSDLVIRPPRPPRGLILSTGEDIPRGHSCRARLLVVEVRPGDVDVQQLTAAQAHAAGGVYATVLAGFVAWLGRDYGRVREGLGRQRAVARDRFTAETPHARTPAAIGDLYLGWDYFGQFAAECGAINSDERLGLMNRVRATLGELGRGQEDHLRAADPVERFLTLVPALLSAGEAHVEARVGGPPEPADLLGWVKDDLQWRPRGNRIGWADDEYLYLDPDASFAAVQRIAATQREAINMSADTLRIRLHDRGLLAGVDQRGGATRFTVRITVGETRVRVLKFCREVPFPVGADGPSGPPASEPRATVGQMGQMGHTERGEALHEELI